MSSSIESLVNREYQYGFVTDIEADTIPPGLSEDVVRADLGKKNEPRHGCSTGGSRRTAAGCTMKEPHWPNVTYPPIDYQDVSLLLGAQDEEAARQPRRGRSRAAARRTRSSAFRSTSRRCSPASRSTRSSTRCRSARRCKAELAKLGIIFCSFGEAVREHPELVQKYLGSVVPYSDNFFAALNSAVFSDGSFVYVPKGVRCPMELSTYFRINAADTGQFERTLIVADEGAYVSYLEGCTAPKRDTNQLHAAVVELVALKDATIKYSTVQNWYAGDKERRGRHLQLRHQARQVRGRELEDLVDAGRDRLARSRGSIRA